MKLELTPQEAVELVTMFRVLVPYGADHDCDGDCDHCDLDGLCDDEPKDDKEKLRQAIDLLVRLFNGEIEG